MNDLAIPADSLLATDQQYLIHPLHHPNDHAAPRIFTEGRGAMLYTNDGKEWIDGLSCLWNVNIGHGRKELADAAQKQMAKLAYASAYTGFSNEPAIRLAEKIVSHAYGNSAAVYFTTGGAESNESAFKFARYHWKRMGKPNKVKILSRVYGYHGVTFAAMSATSLPGYQKMFGPMVPNFVQVPPPYPYRWPGNGDAGIGAADAVEEAILANGADTVAAIICEPVMGAGGVIVPPATYFPRLREICDRHDVLLIADEVITGFGRTGRWFALGHWGVEPDLVAFAKGVTSGYLPLGGVIVSKRVHKVIEDAPPDEKFMHAATYSGHPTCCAVGLANIDIMEKEGLPERAAVVGKRLLEGLETLRNLPGVGDIRGLGMLAAIEFVEDKGSRKPAKGIGARVVAECGKRGLITRQRAASDGPPASGDTLCFAPPLMTPEATIDRIIEIAGESIAAAS
jgi:adenosylmethionine-8-amino-7-oxononanoate aminotransferase